jgi:NADPH:quinone reductase
LSWPPVEAGNDLLLLGGQEVVLGKSPASARRAGELRMKAIRIEEYGGPETLRLRNFELPDPGPGEVHVKLRAAGLNFVDVYLRRGELRAAGLDFSDVHPSRGESSSSLPFTPGYDGAGIIDAVGEGVKDFQPGDRVAYTGHLGTYAEASVVPASKLIPLPVDLSFEQGAAFPLQGMTAHYLLHEYRLPKPGDTVLIHAAAGGMGLLLVQWAKHLGARVIGTVSTESKARTAREAGADEVILYTTQDFVAETKRLTDGLGADLIIDGVGKATFTDNLEAVAMRGHVVIYGFANGLPDPIQPLSLIWRAISISGGTLRSYTQTREELLHRASDVLKGIHAGWLRLHIDTVFPLAEADEAQRRLEARASTGKIILSTAA